MGALYTLIAADKEYIQMNLTDELMEKMDSEGGDPVTLLKAMADCEHVDLGHDTIDGIKVWGIEATDPVLGTKLGSVLSSGMFDNIVVRLWVDVETKLPVRLTAKGSAKNGEIAMDLVIDDFQWDVAMDPAELELVIPEDYKLLGQATWDVTNEGEDIVEVLKIFAELNDSTSTIAPVLERGVTYYWRVDEVQSDGSVVTGDVWNFSPGGLVGWWKLDEDSVGTANDSSGSNMHGTIAGDPAWVDGPSGKALRFDGDGDYVNLGNDSRFNLTSQITVAAWIKVDTFDRQWQVIITKGDGSWRLQRNGTKGSIEFACTGAFVPNALVGSLFGSVSVNDGRWHHIAGTYDGSKICLYVDGRIDITSEATGSIVVNDYNVLIGANAEKPDRNFKGSIDDVCIYSYTLSAEEVKEISAVQSSAPTE